MVTSGKQVACNPAGFDLNLADFFNQFFHTGSRTAVESGIYFKIRLESIPVSPETRVLPSRAQL
jgi:hypothetical protein